MLNKSTGPHLDPNAMEAGIGPLMRSQCLLRDICFFFLALMSIMSARDLLSQDHWWSKVSSSS